MDAKKLKGRYTAKDFKDANGQPMKLYPLEEFQSSGLLQEVNRQFFHPLGLGLSITIHSKSGEVSLGPIFDFRDDPEGVVFGDLSDGDSRVKFENVEDMKDKFRAERIRRFGSIVQPIGGKQK